MSLICCLSRQKVSDCGGLWNICNLISSVLCQVPWVKQTQPRGCFWYQRKSRSQTPKSCGEAEHFQNHFLSKAFWGLHKRVTALVLMLSAFPREEPTHRA